jgi:hypothetical protein
MAGKRETSGNETGNEIVSTVSALIFIGEIEDSRKRRNEARRKRTVLFGHCSFPIERGWQKNVAQRKEPMGWEQRRGRSYYYRKVREGGHVRSKYVGTGLVGQICAGDDDDKRRDRQAMRAADRATRQGEAVIDRQLGAAESALTGMTHATLFAAGYRNHKGQWRKKRREKE